MSNIVAAASTAPVTPSASAAAQPTLRAGEDRYNFLVPEWKDLRLKSVEIHMDGSDKAIKRAGVMIMTSDDKVIMGHTRSSTQEKTAPDGNKFFLKPEFSPASGSIDEEDLVKLDGSDEPDALATVTNALKREMTEELGPDGADFIWEHATPTADAVCDSFFMQVLKLDVASDVVLAALNASIDSLKAEIATRQVPERANLEFLSVKAFDRDIFTAEPVFRDFGRMQLNDTENLVKYYDPIVLAAARTPESSE